MLTLGAGGTCRVGDSRRGRAQARHLANSGLMALTKDTGTDVIFDFVVAKRSKQRLHDQWFVGAGFCGWS